MAFFGASWNEYCSCQETHLLEKSIKNVLLKEHPELLEKIIAPLVGKYDRSSLKNMLGGVAEGQLKEIQNKYAND